MPREGYLGIVPLEQVEQAACIGVTPLVFGYMLAHGGVDALDAVGAHQRVEGRDVRVSHNPFGVVAQGQTAESFEQVYGAIAAACADDGACVGVEQCRLEVGIARLVCPGIGAVAVECMFAGIDGPSVVGEHGHRLIDGLRLDDACGREDGYPVAPHEGARLENLHGVSGGFMR